MALSWPRALGGRLGTFTYLIVTDSAGVSIAFYKPQDFKVIREALQSLAANDHSPTVQVSRSDPPGIPPGSLGSANLTGAGLGGATAKACDNAG